MDLALNNPQKLVCHKPKQKAIKWSIWSKTSFYRIRNLIS